MTTSTQPNNTVVTREALRQRLFLLVSMRDADCAVGIFRQCMDALVELANDLGDEDPEAACIARDAYVNEVDAAHESLTTLAYWCDTEPCEPLLEHELAAFEAASLRAAKLLSPE